jgi:serine/threonine-protein kinase
MECLACHAPNIDGARFCAKCGAPLPVNQAPETDPLIGKQIGGRYRITGILGEGGMGRVYTGEQQMGTSVRKVAVKTLLSQFAKDPQTVARFMREVGTVSELEHPNTIKVYDFGQIEGSGDLYIAMELLAGQTLEDILAGGQPMPPERVDRIIGQVCGSLQEAHDKGIVHRDLKPANIFLTTRAGEEDVVKVLDFGIAKKGDSKTSKTEQKLTQQGTILGTPPYMSPEQFTGKELDARSDLYSLAIVTYEMLTGRLPFEAETPWEWMNQHLQVQPFPFETLPQAANVPQKMRQAVMRALSKDREQRPSNAREFYEDLTLGAVRMSLLGMGAGGSSPSMDGGVAGSPGARGGQTQIGEPLFPQGAPNMQPAGRTVIGAEPLPPPGGVPTAGGQAYPAPPPAPAKSGGGGVALFAVLGVVLLGGGGGAAWYFTKGPGAHHGGGSSDDGVIALPSATAKTEPSEKPTADSGTSSSTGGSSSSGGSVTPPPTASATASTQPTSRPTSEPTTRPTTEPNKKQPGLEACCAGVRGDKRNICNAMSSMVVSGKTSRASAIASLAAQGVHCH